jgi:hypothetical protein
MRGTLGFVCFLCVNLKEKNEAKEMIGIYIFECILNT